MYELKLIYYTTDLNQIVIHSEIFEEIFSLRDWISENVYDFNYINNQPIQYLIVKKKGIKKNDL